MGKPNMGQTWVYVAQADHGPVKVGCTGNPRWRLQNFQSCSPNLIELVCLIPGRLFLEARIKHRWARHHHRGEWFVFSDEIAADIEGFAQRGAHHVLTAAEVALDRLGGTIEISKLCSVDFHVAKAWAKIGLPQHLEGHVLSALPHPLETPASIGASLQKFFERQRPGRKKAA